MMAESIPHFGPLPCARQARVAACGGRRGACLDKRYNFLGLIMAYLYIVFTYLKLVEYGAYALRKIHRVSRCSDLYHATMTVAPGISALCEETMYSHQRTDEYYPVALKQQGSAIAQQCCLLSLYDTLRI
jgi:hypothetical protein